MINDVVVSTRVRLARNLSEYPFPVKLNTEGKQKVIDKVTEAVKGSNDPAVKGIKLINMNALTKEQAISLVEQHLISPEFAKNLNGRALFVDEKTVSIMVNEEDHIRIQVITKGLSLEEAYSTADRLDTVLNEKLSFAYDNQLGYLTQCPTNLGTGMRASVMLHLPALQKSRAIGGIAGNLSKLGLTIRGLYGEGTEPKGAMYQLSNQVTLGISEKAAIDNLKNITVQLVNQEKTARETLIQSVEIQDRISRSLGILKSAKLLDHNEAMELLSNLRLGIAAGLMEGMTVEETDELITEIQPGNILVMAKEAMSASEIDLKRAEIIQKKLVKV